MPRCTPARDLIDASRASVRKWKETDAVLADRRSTVKERRYASHMHLVMEERVAVALRAYVNDLFVDDEMLRRDVLWMPQMRKAIMDTEKSRDKQRRKFLITSQPDAHPLLVTAFSNAQATGINERWFDAQTQVVAGVTMPEETNTFYAYGGRFHGPLLNTFIGPQNGMYPFAETPAELDTIHGTRFATGGVGAANTAARVLMHPDRAVPSQSKSASATDALPSHPHPVCAGGAEQHGTIADLRIKECVEFVHFSVPGTSVYQELDAETFLVVMFTKDSPFYEFPIELKKFIFYWTVKRRAEIQRDPIYTLAHGPQLTPAEVRYEEFVNS